MNADELSQLVQDARIAQFGPDDGTERFPDSLFNSGVVVVAPNGQKSWRSPRDCATNYGAARISDVLTSDNMMAFPCTLILDWVLQQSGGFHDSEPVPYCIFSKDRLPDGPFDGPRINAGILLDYFNHGIPSNKARNGCQLEVMDAFAAAGLIDPLTDEQRQAVMAQP